MRKILILMVFITLGYCSNWAENFEKSNNNLKLNYKYCNVCGMSLNKFYKTSYYHNHLGFCSIRCLLVGNKDLNSTDIKTIDAKSSDIIDATKATFVVGSKVKGTMSNTSKIAFANKDDAKEFAKFQGGEIKDWNETLKFAKKNLIYDLEFNKDKIQKEKIPMGEKIYKNRCKGIQMLSSVPKLKEEILSKCAGIDDSMAQSVLLYLLDQNRNKSVTTLIIPQDAKCPICGMIVSKYPNWAAMIKVGDKDFYFDGMKDMMKYIIQNNLKRDDIKQMLIKDYYTNLVISNPYDAYFVIGSDVLGPMGNEILAFEKPENASNFKLEHKGIELLKFDQIDEKILKKLDGN